jgi:hypothetical protein
MRSLSFLLKKNLEGLFADLQGFGFILFVPFRFLGDACAGLTARSVLH